MDNSKASFRKDTRKDIGRAVAEVFTPLRVRHIQVSRMNVKLNGAKNVSRELVSSMTR